MSWKTPLLRHVFQRHFAWRLEELTQGNVISLGYRVEPTPRYGHGRPAHPELAAIFAAHRANFAGWIAQINAHAQALFAIAGGAAPESGEPNFRNNFFLGLDAAALYTVVATDRPRRFVEVGSGNSTKFVRRAIRDHGLSTRLISIDPKPRAEVELLCDEAIRKPLERTDLGLFAELGPGDILFIDNSHRSFTNSDVTVFFVEILPRLRPGVTLQIHDIFLPFDYPPEWSDRYYSEQYLLACWLLAAPQRFEIMLSNAVVSFDAELSALLSPFWNDPRFGPAKNHAAEVMHDFKGYSFWTRIRD